ncbi:UDP-N-acetylglucosamine 1-carboxyvinyltransferase, partial [Streptococcus suis]
YVYSLVDIMETMGATVKRDGETLDIDTRGVKDMPMPFGKINSLSASYYFYGSLLGRFVQAVFVLPVCCDFGPSTIDF